MKRGRPENTDSELLVAIRSTSRCRLLDVDSAVDGRRELARAGGPPAASAIMGRYRRVTEKRSMISIFGAEIASSLGLDYVVATIGDGGPSGSRSSTTATATAKATPRPRPLDRRMSSVRRREATGGDLVADAMLWTPETGGWSCTFPNRPSESVRRQEGAGDGCAGSASGGAPTAMAMAIAMATSRVLLAPEQVVRAGGQHRGGGDDERAQRGRPRSRRLRRVRPRPRG